MPIGHISHIVCDSYGDARIAKTIHCWAELVTEHVKITFQLSTLLFFTSQAEGKFSAFPVAKRLVVSGYKTDPNLSYKAFLCNTMPRLTAFAKAKLASVRRAIFCAQLTTKQKKCLYFTAHDFFQLW